MKILPPSRKQIKYCMDILSVIGECESDENGQPYFELSMKEADKFIKKNKHVLYSSILPTRNREPMGTAGDWGIPNH